MTSNKIKKLYLDENVIRVVAFEVGIFTSFALIFQSKAIALFLIIDFALRAFSHLTSPLAFIAKRVTTIYSIKPIQIFAPPKIFAATLGFIFSLAILTFYFFELNTAALLTGAVLLICALFESVFKICVGCYVYSWLIAPFKK